MDYILKIGKWYLTDTKLYCKEPNYEISIDRLSESYGDGKIYNWPEHVCSKTWMSELDIYQFNTIFLLALDYFEIPLDTRSWKVTLLNQQLKISRYRDFENIN